MYAGYLLEQNGYNATIFEASSRLGGRIRSGFDPITEEFYELGASFLPVEHRRLQNLITAMALQPTPIQSSPKDYSFYLCGHLFEAHDVFRLRCQHPDEVSSELGPLGLFARHVHPFLPDFDSPAIELAGSLTLDPRKTSFEDFLRLQGLSNTAVYLLRHFIIDSIGEGMENTSAYTILKDLSISTGAQLRLEKGNHSLVAALTSALRTPPHIRAPVQSISEVAGKYHVVPAESSSDISEFDAVIVTVPPPALRNLAISGDYTVPERTTNVLRAVWRISDVVPERASQLVSLSTDTPLGWFYQTTNRRSEKTGAGTQLVHSYCAGVQASYLASLPKTLFASLGRELLRTVLSDAATPELIATTAWHHEPWIEGGYGWLAPSELPTSGPARVEGKRIFIAGDYLSPLPGWIEGALLSAEEAVYSVTRELGP